MPEWIGGRNPIFEVLRTGRRELFQLRIADGVKDSGRVADILDLCKKRQVPIEYVPRAQLNSLVSSHQGMALSVSRYPYAELHDIIDLAGRGVEPVFVLILDTLQDPQNLGTLLRTGEAVGVHGVVLPLRRTATVTPAVVNASSGASEHLLITQMNLARAIDRLKEMGVWVVGLEAGQEALFPEQVRLDGPLALVVGGEGKGMRSLVSDSCDLLLRLPMRGNVDSYNAAVAGSIALYLSWGTRNFTGRHSS